jgi:Tol biopolymer transport system component
MTSRRLLPVLLLAAVVLPLLAGVPLGRVLPDPTHVQLTFLGNVREGALSPDGTAMAYVVLHPTEDDRLYIRELPEGQPIERARSQDLFHLRWSPNGESLLVGASVDGGPSHVLLVPRGEGPTREFPVARWFAMSPDARAFAFAFYNPSAVFIRDVTSGREDTLRLSGTYDILLDLDWSPSGNRIAYVVHQKPSRYEIRMIGRAGEPDRSLAQDSVHLFNPRWSHDGEAVYYLRWAADAGSKDLYRIDVPTGGEPASPAEFVTPLGRVVSFELVREDGEVSYLRGDGYPKLSLVAIDPAGSQEVTPLIIGTDAMDPALSPDGGHVAFTRNVDGTKDVRVQDLESGSTRPIAALEDPICCPAWSPDGSEIAIFSYGSRPQIWKIPSGGGNPVPLTDAGTDRVTLQWVPGAILMEDQWDSQLHRIDPESGQELTLASETLPWMFTSRLSPDGTRLAGSTGSELLVFSLAGAPKVEIPTESPESVVGWSPDGNALYTHAPDSLQIRRRSTDGSGVEILAEHCGRVASVSHDGTRFVCVDDESRLDLWVVRDFQP